MTAVEHVEIHEDLDPHSKLHSAIPNGGETTEIEMAPLTGKAINENNDEGDGIAKVVYPRVDGGDKPWTFEDWLFPPHLPRSCQLLRRENIAVPACYLLVGILQGLIGPLINVYPLDLGATEAQYSTLASIRSLPASFKLVFGFLSDNFPVFGYRRKSYMLFGWLLAASSMGALLLFTDLSLEKEEFIDENGLPATKVIVPENAPTIPFLSLTTLLFGTGFWLADVMGDSVVAEKAKLEPPHARGSVQSSCYSYRFFGLMCAAPFSTTLYSWLGPKYGMLLRVVTVTFLLAFSIILTYSFLVFALLSCLPFLILPLVFNLGEVRNAPVASTREQCGEIWTTVCSRAVWQPLGFVYLYNVLQVGNVAWKEFLKTTLGFTSAQLNSIYVIACVLLYLGILAYKYYLINWSWRMIYIITTLLNGVFSFLQVLLILGITFGLSDFVFALGDDAFAEFIQGIQFLPTTIMMVHLCPAGSEGASYAMFTTVNNSALNLSGALSTQLLRIWDVSKETLAKHELSGMVNLTVLTSSLQVAGVLFVGLLPRTKEELFELQEKGFGSSRFGGTVFLSITFLSILYAIFVGVMNVINPGWMGES